MPKVSLLISLKLWTLSDAFDCTLSLISTIKSSLTTPQSGHVLIFIHSPRQSTQQEPHLGTVSPWTHLNHLFP